jgi:uncharacterized membrane protein
MTTLSKLACACAGVLVFAEMAVAQNTYTTIDFPGAGYTEVDGINSQGDMVGWYLDNPPGASHGFLLSGGVFTKIDAMNQGSTTLHGINDEGVIVGAYSDVNQPEQGFIFDTNSSTLTTLHYPGSAFTSADGINNSGVVVGGYLFANDENGGGFEYQDGTYTNFDTQEHFRSLEIHGISTSGNVVGAMVRFLTYDAFRYGQNQVFKSFSFPGAESSIAYGINDGGVIVGGYVGSRGDYCFTLDHGQMSRVTFAGAVQMVCHGINNSGQIVGNYRDQRNVYHGFLITPGL